MNNFWTRVKEFISSLRNKKGFNLAILLMLLLAVPLTVFIAGQQQEIRQRASENTYKKPAGKPKPAEFVPNELIVKLRSSKTPLAIKPDRAAKGTNLDKKAVDYDDLDEGSIPISLRSFHQRYRIAKISKVFKGVKDPKSELDRLKRIYGALPNRSRGINLQKLTTVDLSKVYKLKTDRSVNYSQVITEIAQTGEIEYVVPNYILKSSLYPNDTYYLDSYPGSVSTRDPNWNPSFDYMWGLKKIGMPGAWSVATGSQGNKIAVIDTGIDYTHSELGNCTLNQVKSNQCQMVAPGYDFTSCNRFDANGSCDETKAYNDDPIDDNGHGTHVSGTILAASNNNLGVAGINWNGRILPVKVLNRQGGGTLEDIMQGIKFAIDNQAVVINMSLGGLEEEVSGYSSSPYDDLFNLADSLNIVVVAAAGNSNDNISNGYYPANHPKVIAVGATDNDDLKASFSNFGMKLSVAAPGVDILSLRAAGTDIYMGSYGYIAGSRVIGGKYYRLSGTSMASPHVAGLAALILAKFPDLTAKQVRSVIEYSADDLGSSGFDENYGWGRINAGRALSITELPPVAQITSPANKNVSDRTVNIIGTASASNFANYTISIGVGKLPQVWSTAGVTLTGEGKIQVVDDQLGAIDVTPYKDKDITIKLEVTSASGVKKQSLVFVSVKDTVPLGSSVTASDTQRNSLNPGAVSDNQGNVFSVWQDSELSQLNQEVSIYFAKSKDQGKTFERSFKVSESDAYVHNPFVQTLRGTVFVGYESYANGWTAVLARREGKIVVRRSIDGGTSFTDRKELVLSKMTDLSGDHGAVYMNPKAVSDEAKNYLYLVWQGGSSDNRDGYVYFSRFNNDGGVFEETKAIRRINRTVVGLGTDYVNSEPTIAVGKDGAVYVAWSETAGFEDGLFRKRIYVSKSTDFGRTFLSPIMAYTRSDFAVQVLPKISADKNTGDVYLAWQGAFDLSSFNNDAWISKSVDNGNSFSDPIRIQTGGYGILKLSPLVVNSSGRIFLAWTHAFDATLYIIAADSTLSKITSYTKVYSGDIFILNLDLALASDQNAIIVNDYIPNFSSQNASPARILFRKTTYDPIGMVITPYPSQSPYPTGIPSPTPMPVLIPSLSPWQEVNSLPQPLSRHISFIKNNKLYAVSQNASFIRIYSALINGDGALGAWAKISESQIPILGISYSSLVASDKNIYLLGGNDTLHLTDLTGVFKAPINDDGTVGTWSQTTNSLPIGLNRAKALVYKDFIYLFGGYTSNNRIQKDIYFSRIGNDGTLGQWVKLTDTPLPDFISDYALIQKSDNIYILGGFVTQNTALVSLNTVYSAKINDDGRLASWVKSADMPQSITGLGAVGYGRNIFITGGDSTSRALSSGYVGSSDASGNITSWTLLTSSLPVPLSYHEMAANDSYVYVVGGYSATSYSSKPTVYAAKVRYPDVLQNFVLNEGKILSGLTVDKGSNYKAEDLLRDLNQSFSPASDNPISSVSKWDPASQNYQIHLYQNDNFNFNISPGDAYYLISTTTGSATLSGSLATVSSYTIPRSWSMISFPQIPSSITTAESLLQALKTKDIDVREINRWVDNAFISHKIGTADNNFSLQSGEGYFLRNYGAQKTFSL